MSGAPWRLPASSAVAAAAATLCLCAAPAVHGSGAPGARFSCDFDGSWSDCGFSAQAGGPDRIATVDVAGVHAVRLETQPGDTGIAGSGTAERADLQLSPQATGCSQGAEQWWRHMLLFPGDYTAPVATRADPWPWGVVFDFHQTGSEGQANFELEVAGQPSALRMAISAGAVISSGAPDSPTRRWTIGPIAKSHWYEFVYHVRWSSGSDGFFSAWVDKRRVIDYRGPTLYAGQGCYLKLANYHTPVGRAVTVMHAQLARAATPQALGLNWQP
ncbi:MAG TPA: heparin lyase I family protein [Steroidobacteraceae bacterium]|nr:heparin lyase I family protein [Steroidobacteraceae bacterium]